ncbi:MAG: hypothetical protein ABI383_08815 [Acidobacteriaceae bacterium]
MSNTLSTCSNESANLPSAIYNRDEIEEIETIAEGTGVHDKVLLEKLYGKRNWKKKKGVAQVKYESDRVRWAELHWYECHGIGKRQMKVKRLIS